MASPPAPTKDSNEHIEVVANNEDDERQAKGMDRAAKYLQDANKVVVVTDENNARVLRRIDLTILPILLSVYALQSLDKTTLSYAAVFGLNEDTNLKGEEYSWLGSIVYLAQLAMQPAVAYFLVKFPIGKFTATMLLCWGISLCGMAAARNFGGLMATRFLLGAFEASVAPAFISIIQMWYRRSEQTNRNALWYAMLGVVNMFGSLLAYGLGHIKSHLYSYQIIFLFCGLLTVVFSVVVFLFMPDSPVDAKFLKGDDKLVAIERLRVNQMGISSGVWRWDHCREALCDPKTWLWFAMLVTISIPSGGVSTFGPLIVASFGFDSFTTILFNIPFGAVQIVSTLGGAYLATKLKKKSPALLLLCIPPVFGIVMLMCLKYDKSDQGGLLAGYYLISCYPGITPLIYSWSGQNTAGDTKRKINTGIMFVGACAGNIIGPHLFNTDEAPHYTRGLRVNLALFIALMLQIVLTIFWIALLNRKHARTRESKGKSAIVVDLSMQRPKSSDGKTDSSPTEQSENALGAKAFNDETDLQNEEFIFLY
ncbi:allantoate permease [Phyllosticta citrichinensis]|uniref:Allantoate permease n=1 Tax=Phyllosticta citrichinensis TaxID=1130410 RepID=A0ABR1XND4_9PEZI